MLLNDSVVTFGLVIMALCILYYIGVWLRPNKKIRKKRNLNNSNYV